MSGSPTTVRQVFRAALLDRPGLWDIDIEAGTIESLHPSISGPMPDGKKEFAIDAEGAVVLPGLHDHHLHLFALAAAQRSVDCSPQRCIDAVGFHAAIRAARPGTDGSIRGVGYYESVAGDLDRTTLDAIRNDVPIRIQHRSGVAWFHNSRSLAALGLADHPDGRLFRHQQDTASPAGDRDGLRHVSQSLAARGVTSVTDATPFATDEELASLLAEQSNGTVLQHLNVMGSPAVATPNSAPRVAAKIVLDEARVPSFETLCTQIMSARRQRLPVAIHLTDRSTTWLALAAWSELGAVAGDRIEHGAVLDDQAMARCSELGLIVVTNPALAFERAADHAEATEADDRQHLWRCGSLIDAGITVRAGTDAPYASADPWASIKAAAGYPVGPEDGNWRTRVDRTLTPREAVGLFTDRSIQVGERADIVVTSRTAAELLAHLDPGDCSTIIGGHTVTP
jgi:predicted amidohydrolase YtcJ